MRKTTSFGTMPKEPVMLSLAGRNIIPLDTLSKSDPMVVVYSVDGISVAEIGRTECIKDTDSPIFRQSILIKEVAEKHEKLRFSMFDIDGKTRDITKHDFIGSVDIFFQDLLLAPNNCLELELKNPKNEKRQNGILLVKAELISSLKTLRFDASGEDLDKKDFLGKSDPYLIFYRQVSTPQGLVFFPTFQTEIVKYNLNPVWKTISINTALFCSGEQKRKLKVECYDWDRTSADDLIGCFETTLEELLGGKERFELSHPEIKHHNKLNCGVIEIKNLVLEAGEK